MPTMPIRLLSTDFDGTLISHEPGARTAEALTGALTNLRTQGTQWAVNTGRQLWFALEGLERAHLPHDPEFVLTSEKDIFRRSECMGWEAFGDWNDRAEAQTADLFARASHVIEAISTMANSGEGVEMVYECGRLGGLTTTDVHTMSRVVEWMRELATDFPEFSFNYNHIWLRFSHRDIHKGSSLAELGRLLAIPREETLAIGDHYNDIPMLNGEAAAMVACPANAMEEVKETVRAAGGYISPLTWGEGVADAIQHFSSNE